jgi:hypothetical protein
MTHTATQPTWAKRLDDAALSSAIERAEQWLVLISHLISIGSLSPESPVLTEAEAQYATLVEVWRSRQIP